MGQQPTAEDIAPTDATPFIVAPPVVTATPGHDDPFARQLGAFRKMIKEVAEAGQALRREGVKAAVVTSEDRGEVLANITLAYRHLEDASMRIGKAIQARDGGVSVYDQSTAVMNQS